MRTHTTHQRPDEGSVLVLALLLLMALGGLVSTLGLLNLRLAGEHRQAREDLRAFGAAEAGLNEAHVTLVEKGFAGARALPYPRATSSGTYQVELVDGRDDGAVDLDHVRLRSVGTAAGDPVGVQLMLYHVPTGRFRFALFGADRVHLNSNVMVDSYDPADGPYPRGVDFVNDFGHVGSFAHVGIDSNVTIHGDAMVGEEGVFDDDAPMIQVSGDQQAGPLEEDMPAITVPFFPNLGRRAISSATTLAPGNYHFAGLSVSAATLTVRGPATLVVDDFELLSRATLRIDSSGGPVSLYATGDVDWRSNTRVVTTSGSALDFSMYITTDNRSGPRTVDLHSNTSFHGTIYAPNARLSLPSNFEVFGAVKAAEVELASNTRIHFDEGLLYDPDAADLFEVASWRRLSRAENNALLAAGEVAP